MPAILPPVDLVNFEYITTQKLGTNTLGQDKRVRRLQRRLVLNGDFTTDLTNWINTAATGTVVSSRARLTSNGVNAGRIRQVLNNLIIGRTYRVQANLYAITSEVGLYITTAASNSIVTPVPISQQVVALGQSALASVLFTAQATSHSLIFGNTLVTDTVYSEVDNVTVALD